mgnify:CR=1 FL=1|jgi:DNA-binding GntR family transcriptional regulator
MNNIDDLAGLRIETPPATLREIALDRMRRAIISGLFAPGERLVERSLCDKLSVSRSVIREVLRHLEAEGLIETLPRHGPIVARLTWKDARQIYDIRAALESAAVGECAALADDALKTSLRRVLAELDRTSQEKAPPAILDITTEFYRLIFEASGHDIAWEIVCRLNGRIQRLRVMTLSHGNRSVSGPAQIRRILKAIEDNDSKGAMEACRAHVSQAAEIAQAVLEAQE